MDEVKIDLFGWTPVDTVSAQTVVKEFLAKWKSPALRGDAPSVGRT
jgi:hypothetical protein